MRIYYVINGVFRTGGQLVNLDHVLALRRLGYDALFLVVPPPDAPAGFAPRFPAGREAPWQRGLGGIGADDVVVVGEMFGAGVLAVADTPARKVLHNQGPFFSFMSFLDVAAIHAWGAEAMVAPSGFAAQMIRRMGWEGPVHVVRPALDPIFAPVQGPRQLRVAAIPNRRPQEYRLIRGLVRSQRPDLNDVGWLEIRDLPRAGVARAVGESELFLATGQLEGLGLPPLEALATGALVVGFHGGGGREYASPENGDWFDDGRHFEIAETLAARIDQLRAGESFAARREAGRLTAAAFSRDAFEAELAVAWRAIAGPP